MSKKVISMMLVVILLASGINVSMAETGSISSVSDLVILLEGADIDAAIEEYNNLKISSAVNMLAVANKERIDGNIYEKYGVLILKNTEPSETRYVLDAYGNRVLDAYGDDIPEILGMAPDLTYVKNPDFPADVNSGKAFDNRSDYLYNSIAADRDKMRAHSTVGGYVNHGFTLNQYYNELSNNNKGTDSLYGQDYQDAIYLGMVLGYIAMGEAVVGTNAGSTETLNHTQRIEDDFIKAYNEYLTTEDLSVFRDVQFYDSSEKKYFEVDEAAVFMALPTLNNAGRYAIFRESGYYFSVTIPPLENILKEMHAAAEIITATDVAQEVSTLEGTFDFSLSSSTDLVSYTMYDVSPNITVTGDMTGDITGEGETYHGSIPITIALTGDATTETISMSVVGTNSEGITDAAIATATINKLITVIDPTDTSAFDPAQGGTISADDRGNEQFSVTQGVPTTEDLYVNVLGKAYLFQEDYDGINGEKTYNVTVTKTYNLEWEEYNEIKKKWEDKSDSAIVEKKYDIKRDYLYYIIQSLDVYGISEAIVDNEALPDETITLYPDSNYYALPEVNVVHSDALSDHIIEPVAGPVTVNLGTKTINGGRSGKPSVPNPDFSKIANEAVGDIRVKNDYLEFNGMVIMDDSIKNKAANPPGNIPAAELINENTLYAYDLTIDRYKENGTYDSAGVITYERVLSVNSYFDATEDFEVDINDVVVHTPVVAYPEIPIDNSFNQVMNVGFHVADDTPHLVIDQTFTVDFPNDGQHLNIKGYGDNDYEAYISDNIYVDDVGDIAGKQIKFPFDVYLGTDKETGTFIPANTWYGLTISEEAFTFYTPYWVEESDEDYYKVAFRTFANNTPIPFDYMYEENANEDRDNYFAVKAIDVVMVGQIYDFKIISTTDSMFESFFFAEDGTLENPLYIGDNDKSGVSDSSHDNVLPLMPGSNTQVGYEKKVVKKGHAVFFSVTTNGNMKDTNDFVVLRPSFYYVDANGNNRTEVDVWYESSGSLLNMASNPKNIIMSLNNDYTGISNETLTDTAQMNYSYIGDEGLTETNYIDNFVWSTSKTGNKIGATSGLALDYQQRIYIGDTTSLPSEVTEEEALMGVQQFYGMYTLPMNTMFVPTGTTSDQVVNEALTDGYIIINFEIDTINGYDKDAASNPVHLSYEGGFNNVNGDGDMYQIEGYNQSQNGFSLEYGDVIFYDSDASASEDYMVIGTH